MAMETTLVRVLRSFQAAGADQLSLVKDERLVVMEKDPSGWWIGRNAYGQCGLFPATFVTREQEPPPPSGVNTEMAVVKVLNELSLSIIRGPSDPPHFEGVVSSLEEPDTTETRDLVEQGPEVLSAESKSNNARRDKLFLEGRDVLQELIQLTRSLGSDSRLEFADKQLNIVETQQREMQRKRLDLDAERLDMASSRRLPSLFFQE